MKNLFRTLKLFTITLIVSSISLSANAQALDFEAARDGALNIGVQSPNAASLGVYGNEPVSLYTGKVSPSIPLTSIEANGYTLNIFLNHNYNGFKPEVIPGSVGLGWSLSAGGVITRTTRSKRDEDTGGYADPNTQTNFQQLDDLAKLIVMSDGSGGSGGINGGEGEAGPDMFYFNFNGISGNFFLDKYGEFQVDSDRPLKIEWLDKTDLGDSRFIVTDIDGTIYKFGNDGSSPIENYVETIRSRSQIIDTGAELDYSLENFLAYIPEVKEEYISAWYLHSIITPSGETIEFEYEIDKITGSISHTDSKFINRRVYTEWIRSASNTGDMYTQIQNADIGIRKLWVSKISHGDRVIDITYNDPGVTAEKREDFELERKAETLTVSTSSGVLINGYDFKYEYLGVVGGNRRLILEEVIPTGSAGQTRSGWKFTYKKDTEPIPVATTHMVDYWGYYNGVTANETVSNKVGAYYFSSSDDNGEGLVHYVAGLDMEPDPVYSEIGLLESITYPTRGTETYQYEANKYSYISNEDNTLFNYTQVPSKVYEASFDDSNPYADIVDPNSFEIDFDFPIILPSTTSGFTLNNVLPENCEIPSYVSGGGGINVVQYFGIAYVVLASAPENHIQAILIGEDGCGIGGNLGLGNDDDYRVKFTLFEEVRNQQGGYGIIDMEVTIGSYWKRTPVDVRTGPGHRIKSVTLSDKMNAGSNDIKKTYSYSDPLAPGKSSGVLVTAPENNFKAEYGQNFFIYRTSGTIRPIGTTRGEHLGYGTIEEITESSGTTYKTVYEYTTARDFPDVHNTDLSFNISDNPEDIGFFQFTSHDYGRGILTKQTSYSSTGQKISSKTLNTEHTAHGGTTPSLNTLSPRIESRKLASLYVQISDYEHQTSDTTSILIPGWYNKVDIKPTSVQYNLPIWSKLISEKNYIYEGLTGKEVTSEIGYLYNPTNHLQEIVTSTNSDGDQKFTWYDYAFEKYNGPGEMEDKNMLIQPYSISVEIIDEDVPPPPSLSPMKKTKFWITWDDNISGAIGTWLPDETFKWSGSVLVQGGLFAPPVDAISVLNFTEYDSRGNLRKVSDMFGTETEYTYDLNGDYLTKIVKNVPPGPCVGTCTGPAFDVHPILDAEYDTRGRVTKITKDGHNSTSYTYDAFSRLSTIGNDAADQIAGYSYTYTGDSFSSTNPNYIQSTSYTGTGSRVSREYFDGIGRSIQSISQLGLDEVVSEQEYNDRGLPWKLWRPITRTSEGLAYVSGYSGLANTEYGNNAYTENKYELNSFNRSNEVIPAGGKITYGSVTTSYGIETISGNDYSVTTTTDQVGNVVKNYIDGWGRTFRTVSDPSGINAITQFEYDQLDRLVEVRPPNYFDPPMGSIASDWVINYEYDFWGNLISKTSNDFGTVSYAYDDADRLRFTQDANQAVDNQVEFIRYDGLGRVLATGIADYSGNFDVLDPNTHNAFEGTDGFQKAAFSYDGTPSTGSYPWSEFATEIAAFTFNSSYAQGQLVAEMYRFAPEPLEADSDLLGLGISGNETYRATDTLSISTSDALSGSTVLLEAGKSVVLKDGFTAFEGSSVTARIDQDLVGTDSVGISSETGGNPWQLQLYSYDREGRIAEKHIYTGGTRDWDAIISYTYNRLGEVTRRKIEIGVDVLYHHYSYDDVGRLSDVTLTFDGVADTETPEITYNYESDGSIEEKQYKGGTSFDYEYDIQGRLTKINDPAVGSHVFSAAYTYFKNGNIHEAEFYNPLTSLGSSHYRYKYIHTYDKLNRITSALYNNYSGGWVFTEAFRVSGLTYDDNGNITGLRRNDDGAVQIDNLTYQYNSSNRLSGVLDSITETTGLSWDAEDATYGYDANGNMTSQTGKFSNLIYSEFNLPIQIETSSGKTLKANYNGAGERIFKEFSEGTWTYYIRDGGTTLATIDHSGNLNFNLIGMGIEGQLVDGVDDPVIDLTGIVSTESESNDTESTADGPIGLSTLGSTSGNQEYDWYYFEVLRSGTVNITRARTTGEYETGEYDLSWTVFKNSSSVATGTGSGSFSVSPGTYYIRLDPLQITDYYDLYLSVQSTSEYATRYFMKDHLGSTRAIVDETGAHLDSYDYYPFGLEMPQRVSISSTQIDPYKYTGHERDNEAGINLDYMLARGYDPAIGRFLQVDPQSDSPEQIGLTPYNYTWNNPVNLADPTGENPWPWLLRTTIGRTVVRTGSGYLAAGAATIGTAIGGTAAYLIIDEVKDNRQYFDFIGEAILNNGEKALETVDNIFSGSSDDAVPAVPVSGTVSDATRSENSDGATTIYRWGNYTNANLTPKEKDRSTGLSFSTVKPVDRSYVQTTLEAINSTGVLKAIIDNPATGHVSVTPSTYPLETTTMNSWIESRPNSESNPHILTITLKSISTRGGN